MTDKDLAQARGYASHPASASAAAPSHTPTAVFTFPDEGAFVAMRAAERFLSARGFSFGSLQRGAPRGILLGDFVISKWRNLTRQEQAECDGTMLGDMRHGPVTVVIRDTGMHGAAAIRAALTATEA